MPTELGILTTLQILDLEYNNITGKMPTELCQLTALEAFLLGDNTEMSGSLPECAWSKLKNLRLQLNGFTGTIPTEYCTMNQLRALILDKNKLKGNMLTCNGDDWPELTLLAVSDNILTVRLSLDGT